MRSSPDYKDEDEAVPQKRVKTEYRDDSTESTNEIEEETRIVREFLQLCVKKGLQMGVQTSLFPGLFEFLTSFGKEPSESTRQTLQTEIFINYFCNILFFKPILPNPNLQELQRYQAIKTVTTMNYQAVGHGKQEFKGEKEAKNAQSKYKNCYGLVTGRVIKSSKEYIKLIKDKVSVVEIEENRRLHYIHISIGCINDHTNFDNFLSEYHNRSDKIKRNRGKTTVFNYLANDVAHGITLVKLIKDFLVRENPDFQSYISKGVKAKKQIGETLSDEKNLKYLREAFEDMQKELEEKL